MVSITDTTTEKSQHTRYLRRKRIVEYLYSGQMKVWHEFQHEFVHWTPPVWTDDYLHDWVAYDGFRSLSLKGRQIYLTTLFCMLMIAIMRIWGGAVCQISNRNQADAKATLDTRVKAPFHSSYPNLVTESKVYAESANRIEIMRDPGMGGDSSIWACDFSGMGQTPFYTLATEFTALCAQDPKKANDYFSTVIHGGQYSSHTLEGAATLLGEMELIRYIVEMATARQRKGFAPTHKDFTVFFHPWFVKPNNIIPDNKWDPERDKEIDARYWDYFASLEAKKEHHVGRNIIPGGIMLTPQQKRWYYVTCKNETKNVIKDMYGDYPSLLSESMEVGSEAQYLVPLLKRAREEGRITNLEILTDTPMWCFWDIGFRDSTVCIFAQNSNNGSWRVFGGFAVERHHSSAMVERVLSEGFLEKTGCRPIIQFPHDGNRKNPSNRLITQKEGGTIQEDFEWARDSAGNQAFDVEPPLKQPRHESNNFSVMRESLPNMVFNENGCGHLLPAWESARIMNVNVDGKGSTKLADGKGSHWHDAGVTMAYIMAASRSSASRGDSETLAYYRRQSGTYTRYM